MDGNGVENTVSVCRPTLSKSSPILPDSSAIERNILLPESDELIYNEAESEDNRPTYNNRPKEPDE